MRWGISFVGILGLLLFILGWVVWFSNWQRLTSLSSALNADLSVRFSAPVEKRSLPNGPVRLSDREISAFASTSRGVFYYTGKTGRVYSTSLAPLLGHPLAINLVAEIKPQLEEVSWVKSGMGLLGRVGSNYTYYNLITGSSRQIKLPSPPRLTSDLLNFASFAYFDENTDQIILADLDKPELKKNLLNVQGKNWRIAWLGEGQAGVLSEGTRGKTVFKLNFLTDQLTKLIGEQPGLVTNWSSDGKSIIYSIAESDITKLYLLKIGRLPFLLPWSLSADNCLWTSDSQIFYCRSFTQLFKITVTSEDTLIAEGGTIPAESRDLKLGSDNTLLFRNELDGMLYGLTLN